MTCDELSQEYTAYALGTAGEAERAEIAEHLSRKCPFCTPGVVGALATVSARPGAVKQFDPPKRLRARAAGMLQPELHEPEPLRPESEPLRFLQPQHAPKERNRWVAIMIPWGLAAALAVELLTVAAPRRRDETAKLEQALSILHDPAAKDVAFGVTPNPSRGRIFVSPSLGLVFIGANLPKIELGKTFELWVIPAGGNPIPAGTFQAEADSSAVYVRPGPVQNGAAAVAVTVEPAGGSPRPTTKPFLVAGLS